MTTEQYIQLLLANCLYFLWRIWDLEKRIKKLEDKR